MIQVRALQNIMYYSYIQHCIRVVLCSIIPGPHIHKFKQVYLTFCFVCPAYGV